MALIDEVSAALQALGFKSDVKLDGIQHGHRVTIRDGRLEAILDVFENTGTIRLGGKESALKLQLEKFVNSYNSDPNFLRTCVAAVEKYQSSEAAGNTPISYISYLFVLDRSKHDSMRTALRAGGLTGEDAHFESDNLTVSIIDERVIVEGLAEAGSTIQAILSNLGARFEEGAETPFKERIPALAARWSPRIVSVSEQRARELLGRDLFDFLHVHDRRTFISSILILEAKLQLLDYSPVVMPIGRAFEGFVCKVLLRLGLVTEVAVSDPEFRFPPVFDSKEVKQFVIRESSHKTMLDAMRQRIREHRHVRLHSQSSRTIQCGFEDAVRYRDRVASDMQEYHKYFKNFFSG